MLHKLGMLRVCLGVTQKSNPPFPSLCIESSYDGCGVLRTVLESQMITLSVEGFPDLACRLGGSLGKCAIRVSLGRTNLNKAG